MYIYIMLNYRVLGLTNMIIITILGELIHLFYFYK